MNQEYKDKVMREIEKEFANNRVLFLDQPTKYIEEEVAKEIFSQKLDKVMKGGVLKLIKYPMLDYKDAKELKDAGFSTEENGNSFYCNGELCGRNYDNCDQEIVRIPTLSELIEEFGNVFYSLTQNPINQGWEAQAFVSYEQLKSGEGKTPKQAVKNLWIAINK